MPYNKNLQEALKKAYRYLSYRQRSKKEILGYLLQKGYEDNIIDEVICYLESIDLIDDSKFVEDWIYFRSQKGNGPKKLRYELKNKGVDEDLIEKKLSLLVNENQEYYSAKKLLEKKLNQNAYPENNSKLWYRLATYLKGRGYSNEVVNKLINEYKAGNDYL